MKMKGSLGVIFCSVILLVSGHKQTVVHEELSQERQDALNVILGYMACIDEGKCNPDEGNAKPVDQKSISSITVENAPAKHEELPGIEPCPQESPILESRYCTPCPKFSLKFEELESLHPELKSLKLQFAKRFDSYASGVTENLEGLSLVHKILDLVILVAEELKKDFTCNEQSEQIPVEEIIAEQESYEIGFVGSVRGIPGVHYPNYTEVPITSFNCADKKYIPGFYADLETGCQVFHVCYEHRRESFLCPLGTIFNQPILACDYWYSSNCSQAPMHFDVNHKKVENVTEEADTEEIQAIVEEQEMTEDLKSVAKFLPVKAKIVQFPTKPEALTVVSSIDGVDEVAANIFGGIVSKSTLVASKAREAVKLFPRPKLVMMPKVVKPLPLVKSKLAAKSMAVPLVKSKLAAKSMAVPLVKSKLAAKAMAVPIVKAKVASAATVPIVKAKAVAVPIVKAKVASAAAVPIVKAKAVAVPLVKAKVVSAATVPIVKAKLAKTPALKAKFVTAAAVPVVKAKVAVPFYKVKAVAAASKPVKAKLAAAAVPVKVKKIAKVVPVVAAVKPKLAVPLIKAKVVKSAIISPLTKKALALGYLKLMKAKKLALG